MQPTRASASVDDPRGVRVASPALAPKQRLIARLKKPARWSYRRSARPNMRGKVVAWGADVQGESPPRRCYRLDAVAGIPVIRRRRLFDVGLRRCATAPGWPWAPGFAHLGFTVPDAVKRVTFRRPV